MTTVGELNVKVTADTSALKRKIQTDAEQSGRGFGSKFGKGLAGMGGLMAGIGTAGLAAGAAVAAFGVKAAAANQTATVSFTKLLGSAENAQKFMGELNTFAAKTPFELPGLRNAASQLLAVGTASQDVIPLMTRIGDATAAVGSGQDGINRAVNALQKMKLTGKVTAESMNMLNEAGVNATDALAAHLGKTPAEIQQMVTDGAIKVEDAFAAIESGAGKSAKRVAGMMDKQSQTFAGMVSTLKDTMTQTLATAAEPLMKSLQDALPALTAAVESIIKALSPVIEKIGPLLAGLVPLLTPVADLLGTMGAIIGDMLIGALNVLIPALTPLIDILKQLGSQIGPVVAQIFGRLVEVVGKLLGAVMPVLKPLADLVFTILDAAAPILNVAADLLLVLIDALTPLLDIVASLLQPLGQLVGVLAKALMPILKPMLPLIEALATVLADVLGRAIGLIITAFGFLVQAGAKVAPFLLRSLVKPVVDGFLAMAENVVGSAESAFSWVPGLGDKLGEAKKAISDFKKNASDGIGKAADTIEKEGTRIGKGLVDQGVKTMKDPSSVSRNRNAGMGLGTAMADGMAIGLRNGQIPVAAAAKDLSNAATASAKNTLDSHSPSRVFVKIGGDVVDGFALGLGDMGKVTDKVRTQLETALAASEKRINEWVDKNRKALDDAIQAWKDYRTEAMSAIMGGINVGDAQTIADESVKAADEAYKALQEAQKRAAGPDASASDVAAVGEANAAYNAAKNNIKTFEQAFADQINQSNIYGTALNAVSNAITSQFGPNSVGGQLLMQQLMQMGPVAGAKLASSLVGADGVGTGLLTTVVNQLKGADLFAGEVGTNMANNAKKSGIDQAENTLKGLNKKIKDEQKRIEKLGEDIGGGMVIGFRSKQGAFKAEVDGYIAAARKSLDSHSPSRVFIGIGQDVGDGFNIGVGQTLADPFATLASDAAFMGRIAGPSLALGDVGAPTVQVFIGDKELTDIVRTEVGTSQDDLARALTLGRR